MNQYVMSTRHSKRFLNIFLRQLIMNIYCGKITEHMDNSEDDYKGYIQRIMMLQVIQQIFCDMLICGIKIVNSDMFFSVTNIWTDVQNNSS